MILLLLLSYVKWFQLLKPIALNSVERCYCFLMGAMRQQHFQVPASRCRLAGRTSMHSLLLAGITFEGKIQLLAFCVFEACVGLFWPSMMKMRSQYVPEESRSTIINFFRIPLNMFVCIMLYNVGLSLNCCLQHICVYISCVLLNFCSTCFCASHIPWVFVSVLGNTLLGQDMFTASHVFAKHPLVC